MSRSRLLIALSAAVMLAATATATASDGEYTAFSCKTPAGQPNGVIAEGGGGWTIGVKQGLFAPADNTCAQAGGGVTASLDAESNRPAGDRVQWDFVAPPSTRISSYRIVWSGQVGPIDAGGAGGDAYIIRASLGDPNYRVRHYVTPVTWSDELIDESNLDESAVHVGIACSGSGTCGSSPAGRYAITQSVVTLRDTTPPTGSASGQAIDDPTWVGTEPFAYQAADAGGGVYRILVLVDGQVRSAQVAAANGGHCADATPSDGNAYVFNSPRPCQPAASGVAAVDVAGVSNGVHDVAIAVEDAAGNATTVYGPTRKKIVGDAAAAGFYVDGRFLNPRFAAGPRVGNGLPATLDATLGAYIARRRGHRTVVTSSTRVRWSVRPLVRGRLRATSGEAIAGATVFVAEKTEGGEWRIGASTRTRPTGRFGLRLSAREPNRAVKLLYFPYSDSHDVVASRQLGVRVRAGVTLHASSRRNKRVRLTGRVLGSLPARGVLVSLQARQGKRYRTFRQVRAVPSTGGRFATTYRFRAPNGSRFRFRALVARQAALPQDTGHSASVPVRVR